MNINKKTSLVFLFIGLMLSFLVNAQSSFFIKGLSTITNIVDGSVWVKSSSTTVNQDIYNLNITNGSKSVQITKDATTITGTVMASVLNVRSGPSTSNDILGVINNGQTVTVIENEYGWYKIQWNGGFGYVSSSYIQIPDGVIVPSVPIPTPTPTGKVKSVTIDPGHGGVDSGAVGATGSYEKDVVLKVGLKVRNLLQAKGYTVVMTRTDDTYISLQQRCDIANNANTDIFVSIHNNSADSSAAHGTETYSYTTGNEAYTLANDVQQKLINSIGLTDRGVKNAGYYVLKYTNMPAILTELAFINNPTEEALLNTDSFQNKCAQSIVDGIEAYNN